MPDADSTAVPRSEEPGTTSHAAATLDRVRAIVRRALDDRAVRVYLYGSWASGTQRRASDIDIALDAPRPLPPRTLARLRDALEESTVPYRVEVVDLGETDTAFRERVRREGILWIASATG